MKAEISGMFFILIASAIAGMPIIAGHVDSNAFFNKCTDDAQCRAGNMCLEGTCKNIFACKPFVDAKWTNKDDLTAGGQFEVRNPEYLTIVPSQSVISSSAADLTSYAARFEGGPYGNHTYERVLLNRFDETKQVWGGVIEVNAKNLHHHASLRPVVFMGGYTDPGWPDTPGSWLRDFTSTLIDKGFVPAGRTSRGVSMNSFWHDASAPTVIYTSMIVSSWERPWPDRFVKVQWYFTPQHKLFGRIDNRPWTQLNSNPNPPPGNYDFRGFAAGWVSAYSNGSLDIRSIQLYDDSCFYPDTNRNNNP